MRLLLAEDEKALSKALVKLFQNNHFSVDAVYDGEDALEYLRSGLYDAAVLDIMMPKLDGLAVLKALCAEGNHIPILMLTAKSDVDDKVLGLDNGANDYLAKPFDSKELLARIRCMTRGKDQTDTRLRMGNIVLDRTTFELSSPCGRFRLANKEYQMMEIFLANPRHLFSTEQLMEKIWGCDCESGINVVWVYISYLRKKLTALKADIHIQASRNLGYALEHNHDS